MTHYLTAHARFTNKAQLDKAVCEQIDLHWRAMSKTERTVLHMLHACSAEYLAAHMTHLEMETKLKISNSTVRRSLRKLEKLHIIERITFVRPVLNGLGANIYVILPVAM